jgi:hypothetical protein
MNAQMQGAVQGHSLHQGLCPSIESEQDAVETPSRFLPRRTFETTNQSSSPIGLLFLINFCHVTSTAKNQIVWLPSFARRDAVMTVYGAEHLMSAYAKSSEREVSGLSSAFSGSVVQRDSRESVVISPPSINGGSSAVRDSARNDPAASMSPGIGVNIHRSKQGVFVVRFVQSYESVIFER